MNNTTPRKALLTTGRLLLTSSSIALLTAGAASAQQSINDGGNVTVTSAADGDTITAAAGVTSTLDSAPVIVVANNDVTVDNAGTLATTGVTQTVQVAQGTTGAAINNAVTGRIEAASRGVNFDGTDASLTNDGVIIGTDSQRNGAVYANRTSNNIAITNSATGTIDAGVEGAGIAIEVGGGGAPRGGSITNAGTVQGRGQASPTGGTAGDGLRFFGPGLAPEYVYSGDITNSGLINSESTQGTVAGIRFANRIGFQGVLTNEAGGVISGAQNGLYFGNDADHTGGIVNNLGTISSDSRALNIDGLGLVVNNSGTIIGTGAQRNGTVYADGTANGFTLNNTGIVDAGVAGSAVSLQLGTADGDIRSFTIVNDGTFAGRGEAQASGASAGLRLFNGAGAGTGATVTATQDIINNGTISAETGAAVVIENVAFTGTFTNSGTITGPVAVDASTALAALNFVQNGGALQGDFIGSAFDDTLTFGAGSSTLGADVLGGVDVTTDAASVIAVSGARSVTGDLAANGTLSFDLGADTLAVDGDTVLGAGSIVNVATTQIGQSDIGSTIGVLSETGTFTDAGTTVNVIEDDFLIDYTVNLGSVEIAVAAADLGAVSGDANINNFGGAITSAAANNRLSGDVFAALNGLGSTAEFEAAALTLLPAINNGVQREIYETQRLVSSQVQDRLKGEALGLWGEAFYRTADADQANLSSLGYDADSFGFTLGLDGKVGEVATVGLLLNYSDIEVDAYTTANATSEIDAFQIGGYAGFDLGQSYVNAELGYSVSSVDSSRTALGAQITGDSDVDGVYASLNAGYDIETGNVLITPNGGLRYAQLSRDTFTENGGLGLTLDADSAEFLEARIGVKVAGTKESGIVPFLSVDYAYDLSTDPLATVGSFNGGADTFTVIADEASASRFDVAAGLDFVQEGGLSIGAEYRGRFASDYQSHSGGVRVRFAF